MPPVKKSTKKPKPPPQPETPAEEEPTPAELEAESRRAVAQELLDAGYTIDGAGEDEKGNWFLAQRDDKTKKIYVKGAKS